jgi:hypothetical protein
MVKSGIFGYEQVYRGIDVHEPGLQENPVRNQKTVFLTT